jgi:hypothetical protein
MQQEIIQMNVQQVKQIAYEWLTHNLVHYPGLCGAHFVGSITTMPDEAYFPAYKDVDMHLIFKEGSPILENHGPFANLLEIEYRGAILEGGYKPASEYQTPELVLANPEITHHLTVDSLIYDPDGWLKALQEPVRREYARRKWVMARIDFERKGLEWWKGLRQFAHASDTSGLAEVNLLGYNYAYMASLLCVATLQAPSGNINTMRNILVEYNRLDLYQAAMEILGLPNISAALLETLLVEGAEAFDLAVRVRRSPNPFQHKLNPHQRGYFVDKCRSLMDAGLIDQAAGWMLAFYSSSINVILADGPEEVKPAYVRRRNKLLEILGIQPQESLDGRFERIMQINEQFFALAGDMVRSNPNIFD